MADQFLMLVEGDDDYHVFQHLLTAHRVHEQLTPAGVLRD